MCCDNRTVFFVYPPKFDVKNASSAGKNCNLQARRNGRSLKLKGSIGDSGVVSLVLM